MIPVLLCYTYPSAKTSKIDTVALRYTTWTVVRQRISKADTVALQYATWTVVRHELKYDKKTQNRFRGDSEGRGLLQENFVMGLRLSGE